METKTGKKGIQWVNIYKPTNADITWIKEKFGVHPLIAGELKGPSTRAKVESYDGYLFFVYYFPIYDNKAKASIRTEIDFIVTKDTVITVHYEPLGDVLDNFDASGCDSSLKLLHGIIAHLIVFEERQLRHIREKVEAIGKEIFQDKEREMLERLAHLKRDISEDRIVVRLQEPVLHSLLVKGEEFWGPGSEVYLNDLLGDHLKVVNQLEDYREAVVDFEETNNQLMNLKINTAMKTFTSLSFLTFPFVLIATLFGMNVPDMPFVGMRYAFWVIVGAMVVCMLVLVVYFKKKNWF